MLKHRFLILAVATIFVLVGGTGTAQVDLQSNISGSVDAAATGQTVSYTVEVGNSGTADPTNAINLDVYLPTGVPTDVNAYLDDDPDAVAAFNAVSNSLLVSDTIWNDGTSGIFFGVDGYCENFLLQPQNLVMSAGIEGTFSYDAVMPQTPLVAGAVHITSANMDADRNFGRGGCADGGDCHDHPCLGPRVSTIAPITGTVELVDDGSNSQGCNALQNFTAGNIALIDRGTCAFETKIVNALNAGATAVIIADHDDFTDSTTEPDDILNMACTDFCDETVVTIPAVFISYADGLIVHGDLATGVTATIGKKEVGNEMTTTANIWENGTAEDTNPDNNISEVTTTVMSADYIFNDGFESGTTSAWAYSTATSKNAMESSTGSRKGAIRWGAGSRY